MTDGVAGLDRITPQMPGGEHRPEQQEICRAVAEALVAGTISSCQPARGPACRWPTSVPAALGDKKVVVVTATTACI